MFGGGNGLAVSGDRGLQAEEELIFSTKEGQTVLAARNASLLSSYSGLFDYAVRHNVDATKSTSMGDANTGARLLSVIQPKPSKSISEGDEIPNSKEPLSKSTKRRRISATSSCQASTPKKKVRIGSKDQTKPLQLEVYSRVTFRRRANADRRSQRRSNIRF